MAAGEYVSVGSQRDAERADVARETKELAIDPDFELDELTQIYVRRGLDRGLAGRVAQQLMAADSLGAHLRDELGFNEAAMARPVQAAIVSALSFGIGGFLPVLAMILAPASLRISIIAAVGLMLLGTLGGVGGRLGGASATRAALRVMVGGGLAMALTAGIGRLIGSSAL